jgi:hypothetical protein
MHRQNQVISSFLLNPRQPVWNKITICTYIKGMTVSEETESWLLPFRFDCCSLYPLTMNIYFLMMTVFLLFIYLYIPQLLKPTYH